VCGRKLYRNATTDHLIVGCDTRRIWVAHGYRSLLTFGRMGENASFLYLAAWARVVSAVSLVRDCTVGPSPSHYRSPHRPHPHPCPRNSRSAAAVCAAAKGLAAIARHVIARRERDRRDGRAQPLDRAPKLNPGP